jgi:hypothetical protein
MTRSPTVFDASRRRHLRAWWGASLLIAAPALQAQASGLTIAGVSFGGRAEVGGQQLRLNGVGLRASSVIKGFAAGLYLLEPSNNTEQVLHTPGPKRLRMRMLIDVPIQVFTHAVHKGIRRNVPEAEQNALLERMGAFDAILLAVGKVFDGDVIDLDYLPGSGLVIAVNGKPRGAPIPGEDLYAALMLVFIGERPVDARLKAGLLAQRRTFYKNTAARGRIAPARHNAQHSCLHAMRSASACPVACSMAWSSWPRRCPRWRWRRLIPPSRCV